MPGEFYLQEDTRYPSQKPDTADRLCGAIVVRTRGSCAAVWGSGEINSPDSYPVAPREGKGKAYTGVRQWAAPSRGKMVHVDSGAVAGSWGPPAGRSCLDRVSQSAWLNLAGEKGPAHV